MYVLYNLVFNKIKEIKKMDELKLLKDINAWLSVLIDEYNILHKDFKLSVLKDLKNKTSILINNKGD